MYALIGLGEEPQNLEITCMFFRPNMTPKRISYIRVAPLAVSLGQQLNPGKDIVQIIPV
jgi:hypothetical protein